jgi:hypothetical protein
MSASDPTLGVRRDAAITASGLQQRLYLRVSTFGAVPERFLPLAVLDCGASLAKGVSLGGETRISSTANGANASPDLYMPTDPSTP